jgi:hypothetical protein
MIKELLGYIPLFIILIPAALVVGYFIISLLVFIYEETICNIRNAKRFLKETWWDFEWKWKQWRRRI